MRRLLAGIAMVLTVNALDAAEKPAPDAAQLQALAARFGTVGIAPDVAALPDGERAALAKLVEAARIMDALFLRQVWAGNETLQGALAADPSPLARARLDNLLLNKGPWSRLDHDAPFMPGIPKKPL